MSRDTIYYWKCDRPSAFHGLAEEGLSDELRRSHTRLLERELRAQLWPGGVSLEPIETPGNHLLWKAVSAEGAFLIRVEDGPERDGYQAIESHLLDRVREAGVPTPLVAGADASRQRVPFAWQAIEWIPHRDLQHWHARGEADLSALMPAIGEAIARWQSVPVAGFGPFRADAFAGSGGLRGFHREYPDYYHLQLERHLGLLVDSTFLTAAESARIENAVRSHQSCLDLPESCLVHKDLAFWNILGTRDRIAAFIDFDDAVAGDPLDDLSLLACFHPRETVDLAIQGYRAVRPLPEDWEPRLHLHTLRNLIVKAVIRVGAGYFDRDESFFLIGNGSNGTNFREETKRRLLEALKTLE